ncbi:MAG: helix-turn-helix transcriptional regulator [Euryarchaeota archaeon]|nr:helix-turn-helix transcriptional regulator [Euryarchaeota archaeon]
MKLADWKGALSALGNANGMRVAEALEETGWRCASEIARPLKLHIATVQSHLAALESAGVAESRERVGGRPAREYRLRSREVELSFAIEGKDGGCISKAERLGLLSSLKEHASRISPEIGARVASCSAVAPLVAELVRHLGRGTASAIVAAAAHDAGMSRSKVERFMEKGEEGAI